MGIRATAKRLWCGVGAVLGGSLGPAAQSAYALTEEFHERAAVCAAPRPVAHASAGLGFGFGGKELSTASAGRTAAGITAALTTGPLPAGARVVGSRLLLPDGRGSFTISVESVRMPGTLPHASVATVHFLGPSAAVVRVSDRPTADLIRQAVAARLTEVAAIVSDRSENRRLDVTSGLTEGVLTTADSASRIPLSPRAGEDGRARFRHRDGPARRGAGPPRAPYGWQHTGNPGFETGGANPWTAPAGVVDNGSGEAAHSGSWKAWLDGYGSAHTDSLSQSVTIPANCQATLSYYVHIDTAQTTTATAYDKLTVQANSTTLASCSNLNKNTGYVQKTFDLSSYAGQTVTLKFTGTEDSSLQTSFVIDDAALTIS